MPELQSASAAFTARIAEYVAQMDAEEAEAYRRANEEQAEVDRLIKETKGARL